MEENFMSHLSLYREFRPKTFDDVISQNHIVETLKHQIQTGTVSHAYLFCGTRGTGKTSCAKIFARAVNCLNPKNGSPCGECEVCKKIEANGNLDIVEIDAASNNRVDEIRDLREKVNYLPTVSKYKVYIIDEVHMLTDSAFNALLKTLEEPPKHVIFILATTEPEKLPATILSRCMRFDFKLVSMPDLTAHLAKIFKLSNIKFEERALEVIARAGNGSVRDTLSVAEMCKAFANDNITYASVQECLGLTDDQTLLLIADAIIKKDGATILTTTDKLYAEGKNLSTLLGDLCNFFRNCLSTKLLQTAPANIPQNMQKSCLQIASSATEKQLLDILKNLSEALGQIKFCANEKVFVETALIGLFYNDNLEIELLKQKVERLESAIASQPAKIAQTNFDITSQTYNYASDTTSQNGFIDNSYQKTQILPQNRDVVSNAKNDFANAKQSTQSGFQTANNLIGEHLQDNATTPFDTQSQQNKDQNSQLAKAVFGDMVGFARRQGEMLLYAGFQDVTKVTIQDGALNIFCKSSDAKNIIQKHEAMLLSYAKQTHGILKLVVVFEQDNSLSNIQKISSMLDGKLEVK